MTWKLVCLDDVPVRPWKNAGGGTRELLVWPGPGMWTLRISVAEIAQSGPFSRYPGLERWFAVLEGGGVQLRHGRHERVLTVQSEPHVFDGASAPDCKLLDGPTLDLNLMARPGRATMRLLHGTHGLQVVEPAVVGVYGHQAGTCLRFAGERVDVPPRTLCWGELPAESTVEIASDAVHWMEMRK